MKGRPEGFKALLLVVAPKLIGGGAVFGLNLLLVRYVDPAAFGVIAFCTMAMVLFDGLVASAIDLAVMRVAPEQARAAAGRSHIPEALTSVEQAALWLKLGIGGVLLIAAGIGAPYLARRILDQSIAPAALVAVACSATSMMFLRSCQVYCQLRSDFAMFGVLDLATTLLRGGSIVVLLWSGVVSPVAVLACYGLAPVLPGALWAVFQFRRIHLLQRGVAPSEPILRSMLTLGRVLQTMLATTLVGAIVARLDVLLLSVYSNPANVGLYSAAATIASVPDLFGSYLSSALTPRIVRKTHDGTFFPFFRSTQLRLYGLAAVMMIVGWSAGQSLMGLIFPAKYFASIELVSLLLPAAAAGLVTFPLTLNFLMFYSPRTFLWLDLLTAPLLFLALREASLADGARSVAVLTSAVKVLKAIIVHAIAWRAAWRLRSNSLPPGANASAAMAAANAVGGAA